MSKKFRNGLPLKEGIEIAGLKSYDKEGFMIDERELYYKKDITNFLVLDFGNYVYQFDAEGKLLITTETTQIGNPPTLHGSY
jgi:hypothetical protein